VRVSTVEPGLPDQVVGPDPEREAPGVPRLVAYRAVAQRVEEGADALPVLHGDGRVRGEVCGGQQRRQRHVPRDVPADRAAQELDQVEVEQ
jgi:hypothetical protein